jgi:hypothetical protein
MDWPSGSTWQKQWRSIKKSWLRPKVLFLPAQLVESYCAMPSPSSKFPKVSASTLSHRRQELGTELYVTVYLSLLQNKTIVAPLSQIDVGFYKEQETLKVIAFDSPVEELGLLIKESLLRFDKNPRGSMSPKLTDWAAYKASKAKSVKAFQQQYLPVQIYTINANFRAEAQVSDNKPIFIGFYAAIGVSESGLGSLLLDLYQCYQSLPNL